MGLVRNIVGIIGNVISFGLFISPSPVLYRIFKNKSSEEFHPYPYLATTMNCLCWIFYGLPFVSPDSLLVVTINSVGLVLEMIYLSIFFWYTTKKNRKIICFGLLGELVGLAALILVAMLCFHDTKMRKLVVGVVCNVFGVIMYASPLSIVFKVIKTKSPEFMPFWLCVAGFVNGAVWFTYGNLKPFDLFICIGNGLGCFFGFIQLLVYGFYSIWGASSAKDDAKPGVQLQNTKTLPV